MRIAISHWNNVLVDVEKELRRRGHEIVKNPWQDMSRLDAVVLWNETEDSGRPYVEKAKKFGARTILVQHGRRGTSRIYPPFNEELASDIACVWGEGDKRRLIEVGIPEERIVVTGTPIWRHIKPKIEHSGLNVVFSPEHWDGREVVENAIVAGQLRRLEGVKIITKGLEGEHDPKIYDNLVMSDRNKPGHLDVCVDVLRKADLVVGISESTFELMAQIMDIPVVIADIWIPKACAGDERYKEYKRIYSNACKRVKNIFDLNKTIKQQLKHPDELKEQRAKIAIEDGGTNIKDPLKRICDIIEGNGQQND